MGECSVSSSSLSWYAAMGLKLQGEVPCPEFIDLEDAQSSPRADNNFKATEKRKSCRGDYDLNRVESSNDTVKEALRKTLLDQEVVFRKQVVELHRIYWTQKNITKDFGCKELDEYNFVKGSAQPMLGSFINHMKNQSLATEKASLNMTHYSSCETEYLCNDDLRLSLSICGDRWQNGGGKRTCREKDINFSSKFIIDLEESTETESKGDVRATTAFSSDNPLASSGAKQDSLESIQSSLSFANSLSKFSENGSTSDSTNRGATKLCRGDLACKDDKCNCLDREELDLNRDLVDVLSHHLNDQAAQKVNEDNKEYTGSNDSPASCKSNHIAENCSSTQTVQSGSDLEISKVSSQDMFKNSESPKVVKPSPHQDSESFAVSGAVKPETCRETTNEFAEVDVMVREGAVSLLYFASHTSSRDGYGLSKAKETSEIWNMKKDTPQYSSDSYESMVLKLPESSVVDYCVSSNPFEVADTSEKDNRIKFRRGRRLKDFKKDILPQLSSLSSDEISEDMKIMQGVLRSREYKRLRSKTNNAQNWSAPVRSRRSKPNYGSRRYYS